MSVTESAHHYRSRLLDALPWVGYQFMPVGERPPETIACGYQCHTATVLLDQQATPAKSCKGDAVIGTGSQPVAVYTADCLPILIADQQQRHVAAVHGGLRGVMAGIHINTMEKLCQLGANRESLRLVIGPAIGPCCYELGEEIISGMARQPTLPATLPWSRQQPDNPAAVRPQAVARQQGIWFDLPALAQQMAQAWGLPTENIEQLGVCTYCSAEECASYRRNTHFANGYQQRWSWICRR